MAKITPGKVVAAAGLNQRVWDQMGRQRADDEYLADTRKYALEGARARSDLLPMQVAADRARLGLSVRQSEATGRTLEEETAARQASLGLQRRRDTAETGLVDKRAEKDSKMLDRDVAQLDVEIEELPNTIKRMRLDGLINDEKAGMAALSGLGYAMQRGPEAVVAYANKALPLGFVPGMEQRTVKGARVGKVTANGQEVEGVILDFEDGESIAFTGDAIKQAMASENPADYKVVPRGAILTKDGQEVLRNDMTADGASGSKGTALTRNVEFLVQSGIAGTPKEAFDMLRKAVQKPEGEAIMDLMRIILDKGSGYRGKGGIDKALQDARRIVQSVKGAEEAEESPAAEGDDSGLTPNVDQILRDFGVQ